MLVQLMLGIGPTATYPGDVAAAFTAHFLARRSGKPPFSPMCSTELLPEECYIKQENGDGKSKREPAASPVGPNAAMCKRQSRGAELRSYTVAHFAASVKLGYARWEQNAVQPRRRIGRRRPNCPVRREASAQSDSKTPMMFQRLVGVSHLGVQAWRGLQALNWLIGWEWMDQATGVE